MTKEIKFRQALFDNKGNFEGWHYWGFVTDKHGLHYNSPMTHGIPFEEALKNNYQSTSFKDKNKVEIFEGDIVLDNAHVGKSSYVVQFHAPSFLLFKDMGHENTNYYSPLTNRIEIIGNIYEHPELLK